MRILYVADSLMAGGIESQLVELATRLDPARFQPRVLCLYGPRARALHFAPRLCDAGVPVSALDLDWTTRDKARGLAQIAAAAWSLRPSIIQAEGYHANLLTRLARPVMPPLRLVGTVRGRHSRKQLAYERMSYWLCARIVVNARHLEEMLVRGARVPAAHVVHIPNGIDTARFAHPHDTTLRQRIAHDARRVFVSLGRVSFEKNLHWTAEAFGLLARQGRLPAGVQLHFAGPIDHPAAQVRLDEAVERDRLRGIVVQHPATDAPEDFYHAGDISIVFSPAEGLANACVESLAAGRPVIVSAGANAAAVIADGTTGWMVPTGDVAGLAEQLARIMALPAADLARMRQACIERAREYDVGRMVARYSALYTALAGHGAGTPATKPATQHGAGPNARHPLHSGLPVC